MRPLLLGLLAAALLPASASASGLVAFQSPTKNIGCYLSAASARCDIRAKSWTLQRPAGCPKIVDFGQGLIVNRIGRGHVVCAGDTALGAGKVLPYGRTIGRGGMHCTSTRAGVRCTNAKGHGFLISRAAYRLF